MFRLPADENFNNGIIRGVLRRRHDVDIVRVQDVALGGADDATVLEWAARHGRVLLTQDIATLPAHAYDRVAAGRPMPGVFLVAPHVEVSRVIEDILLLAECSLDREWEGQVRYLPLL